MADEDLGVSLDCHVLETLHRGHRLHRVEVEARDDLLLEPFARVSRIGGEEHRAATGELDKQAVVARRVARRLDQMHTLGDLLIAAQELDPRSPDVALGIIRHVATFASQPLAVEVGVEAHVGIAQHLERCGRLALGEFERVADRAGLAQVAVPAAMIEVVVRVDDVIDVLRPIAGERERADKGLLLRLNGLLEGQHGIHVVAVEAGIEEIEPVGVVDQHAVDGKAHLARRPPVPVDVEAVDHQRAAVENEDPRLFHGLTPVLPSSLVSRYRSSHSMARYLLTSWPGLSRPSTGFSCSRGKERGCPERVRA